MVQNVMFSGGFEASTIQSEGSGITAVGAPERRFGELTTALID